MKKNNNFLSNFKFDITAGLVVFFVALPLCLGISLASTSYSGKPGLEDFSGVVLPGIIAGIIGGIIVGSFSGSRYGVSGPAAGLITIAGAAIVEFGGFENGGFEKFALAVVLAGGIQFLLGLIKAGFVAYYIPFSVIKGMLAGIGITIIIKELPHFFGYDKDPEGDMDFVQVDGHTAFEQLDLMIKNIHWGATLVALISLIILLIWSIGYIKKHRILSLIPGPLLAIIISIGVASLISNFSGFGISGEHLVNVPTPKSMSEFKGMLYFPDFNSIYDVSVWRVAVVIAIVASIESLLCVEATDKMDPNKGRTPMNRELRAQGIGNVLSGLLGGLPITQVIVRSAASISAGAKTKMTAVFHGVFLLGFVILIPGILNMIPRSTLAAVLVLIGWKLVNPKSIFQMFKAGWEQYVPFLVVAIVMLVTDLLIGVGSGLVVAFFIILYRNYKNAYFLDSNQQTKEGEPIRLRLSQHATFLNKASILKTLDNIEDGRKVIIDLSNTIDIDYDIKVAINDFIEGSYDREIEVEIIDEKKLTHISVGH